MQRARANGTRSKLRRLLDRLFVLSALGYSATLAGVVCALYFIGEQFWVTTALLYAPRVLFAVPLPFAVVGLLLAGKRRLLWTQLVSALLLLFPLMGFVLPWPHSTEARGPSFRLLSFNADSGFFGVPAIMKAFGALSPDIVLIQEGQNGGGELSEALRLSYPHVEGSTQFTIASKYPIVESTDPDRLPYYGRQRSPRFMRYLIDTPLGKVAFYSVHPISPRGALHIHRFHDALHQLRTGAFLQGDPEADVGGNAGLRALQMAAVSEMSAGEHVPVVLAGDTNLPDLSLIFRRTLSRYADAFKTAGWGFGYTFPARRPFLRLDRILSGPEFHFRSFRTGCVGVSDHLCVVADIERQP